MQSDQRPAHNHALKHAIALADERGLPVVCLFTVDVSFPEANRRHFAFMFEGLKDTFATLSDMGITTVIRTGHIEDVIGSFLDDTRTVVTDVGHLRWQRERRKALYYRLIDEKNSNLHAVSTHLLVPVDIASGKEEYGAYTLRPRLKRHMDAFADDDEVKAPKNTSPVDVRSDVDVTALDRLLGNTRFSVDVPPVTSFKGGPTAAKARLDDFIKHKLSHYEDANDPGLDLNSQLSPYLHFGQISPLTIMRSVRDADAPQEAKDAFLEQLIIRRELAHNFVWYNTHYDEFDHMTVDWAYKTMQKHSGDPRPHRYSMEDYLRADTHDPHFNAAMKEMMRTGHMKNYMRMYWGKKIIEWSEDYRTAYTTMLTLNNRFFLDGRDANSFTGVAWCFGKHDRAWKERDVFGKLRYMNEGGLKRKFDMDAYITRIRELETNPKEESS